LPKIKKKKDSPLIYIILTNGHFLNQDVYSHKLLVVYCSVDKWNYNMALNEREHADLWSKGLRINWQKLSEGRFSPLNSELTTFHWNVTQVSIALTNPWHIIKRNNRFVFSNTLNKPLFKQARLQMKCGLCNRVRILKICSISFLSYISKFVGGN
jgi:hypothetical protein